MPELSPLTVTFDPTNPIPGQSVRCIVGSSTGNVQQVALATAPTASQFFRADGLEQPAGQGQAITKSLTVSGQVGTESFLFNPDVGGKWSLALYDFRQGRASGRSKSFAGADDGYQSTLLVRTLVDVYVSDRLTTQVGFGSDVATLTLFVRNNTILSTTVATYGELTPSITADTPGMASLIQQTEIVSAVAALANTTMTLAVGDLLTPLDWVLLNAAEHFEDPAVHHLEDDLHAQQAYNIGTGGDSLPSMMAKANALRSLLIAHMHNDTATGTAGYHWDVVDGYQPDTLNVVIAPPAFNALSLRILVADLYRAFTLHLAQIENPASHLEVTAFTPLVLPAVVELDRLVLTALADGAPAEFGDANQGTILALMKGFSTA